mmetsp:Transcript_22354/g.48565  ORF Transcript_22354/g.48565 Transcript_22354/m.48565 type:complete len:216 (+) Transcript_22354:1681-2328(+)
MRWLMGASIFRWTLAKLKKSLMDSTKMACWRLPIVQPTFRELSLTCAWSLELGDVNKRVFNSLSTLNEMILKYSLFNLDSTPSRCECVAIDGMSKEDGVTDMYLEYFTSIQGRAVADTYVPAPTSSCLARGVYTFRGETATSTSLAACKTSFLNCSLDALSWSPLDQTRTPVSCLTFFAICSLHSLPFMSNLTAATTRSMHAADSVTWLRRLVFL